ncbi:MAG: 3-hydroxyacyl-CoA dehydrogenase family protein [Actinomycetota bacterium]
MRVAVIGAGTMGAGIATSCVAAEIDVVLVERDPARAEIADEQIRSSLERLAAKDEALQVDAALARLDRADDLCDTEGSDLVIEAIPELLDLKREVFAALDALHGPEVVLATNTSSLSVSAIAEGLGRPGRVVGTHFFNPVPVSSLVEIVVGENTADEAVARAAALSDRLGKVSIVVQDSPGFASSRLGLALGLEAIRMLEQGVASAEDIDTAMHLGYRHPMGPLRLTDLVGLDVRLDIARHLHRTIGDRFAPPDLLAQMVADGHLGRKTGRGFFEW